MKEKNKVEFKRWTASRKLEVVMRYMKGETLDALSREIGLPASEIEQWHQSVLRGAELALKSRTVDPLEDALNQAKKQIGELSMQLELLKRKPKAVFPLGRS